VAELTSRERLQPSLLDRLTDHEPSTTHEAREARIVSEAQLRELVRRDLAWLLNTTCMAAVQDLRAYPEAARSVINYGIGDLAGQTLGGLDRAGLEKQLRDAIVNFEPRLRRNSVKLQVLVDETTPGHNSIVFAIEAELWAQPLPVALYLRTEIDLESGVVNVEPAQGARER